MIQIPYHPQRGAHAFELVVLCLSLCGLVSTRCQPHAEARPGLINASIGERSTKRAPVAIASASARNPRVHIAKSRSWRVREDSPFTLVAEGLRVANVAALDKDRVLCAAPCTWSPSAPDDGPDSYSIYPVEGDRFAAPLPTSPSINGRRGGMTPQGHWPADLWLHFEFTRDQSGAQHQFFRWDGKLWQTIPAGPTKKGLEPYQVLDWYDGAKLIAQIQKWHYSVSYAVAPFLVWGQTSHAAPDFSTLPFPRDERHDLQLASVEYAILPTHEVFVLHNLSTHDLENTATTVAYSTRGGQLVMDRLPNVAGSSGGRFATGRLGQREVVVAWGDVKRFGKYRSWLQLYDGVSSTALPTPNLALRKSPLDDVWFAGGRLWARSGSLSEIWQFDGASWAVFARVEPGMQLAPVAEDGSLWGAWGPDLFRFEKDGRKVSVPFLAEPTQDLYLFRLVATGPDDVWLVVTAEGEDLVFRTKKMKSILACE